MTEGALVQDLAALTAVVGIVAVVFSKLSLPKVIGYLFAGILMSEHTWGGSFFADIGSIGTIGQLGIVFLMFSMGLGFSPSKLKSVKGVAMPVAAVDTVIMIWIGYTVGTRVFGWGMTQSLFLGAAICDSATTMLGKVIDEMKWSSRPFVRRAIGTSVFEDMICIGVLALLGGVLKGEGVSFSAVGASMAALVVFLLAVTVFGFAHMPRFFQSVRKLKDDEALLMAVLGCCFFVSFLAYRFEYSLSLGAFLVGVIAATSQCRRKIEELAMPLRTMFAAVFFVSIGVLLDPVQCIRLLPEILLLTAVVVVCKTLNCTFASLACGESVKASVQIGMSLAQVGEFAFMVALLYAGSAGAGGSEMYQITVAVSILTTVLNPFLIRYSEGVGDWVERRLGEKTLRHLETYRGFVAKYRFGSGESSALRTTVRKNILTLGVIGALLVAVSVAMSILSSRDWSQFSTLFDTHKQMFFCFAANLFAVSMLAPLFAVQRRLGNSLAEFVLGGEPARWRDSLQRVLKLIVSIVVFSLFFIEISMLNVNLAPPQLWAQGAIFVILLLSAVLGWRFFSRHSRSAMTRMKQALSVDDRLDGELDERSPSEKLANVGGVTHYRVERGSPVIGHTLVSLDIRARTGVLVVSVERDGDSFGNPGPDWVFRENDVLFAIGSDSQIEAFLNLLKNCEKIQSEMNR